MTAAESTPHLYGIVPPGHRLHEATHVGRVRLQVADLERSIAYYEHVIGLRVIRRDGPIAHLGPQGDDTVLAELHEQPGARPVGRRGHIGLYHFAILLPERAALGRFAGHLADIGSHAGMSDHSVSEAVYLQDPDGLGIEVYADRPRGAWSYEGRQLSMTTTPLDAVDLIASAQGVAWSGAPAGTTIGHVHLYVRDMAGAEAFYHAGLGFDKVVWSYPGALFLSAGGYHHHVGTNAWAANAPLPTAADARLLEWELVMPTIDDVEAAAASLVSGRYQVRREARDIVARDPWGTQVRLVAATS